MNPSSIMTEPDLAVCESTWPRLSHLKSYPTVRVPSLGVEGWTTLRTRADDSAHDDSPDVVQRRWGEGPSQRALLLWAHTLAVVRTL